MKGSVSGFIQSIPLLHFCDTYQLGSCIMKEKDLFKKLMYEMLIEAQWKEADYEFTITMPSLDSDYAIQYEQKIMDGFICKKCSTRGSMQLLLQETIPFTSRVKNQLELGGDQITYRCNSCNNEIVVDFLFEGEESMDQD
jgi:RNase P subunit RPR2